LKIAFVPLSIMASFAALLLAEEMMRDKSAAEGLEWCRISTNWGLAIANWALFALVPVSSLLARIWTGPGLLASWSAAIAFLPLLLLRSAANYGVHRALHALPWLWRIHRVHHSDTLIDCTTGLRSHAAEAVIVAAVSGLIVIALGPPLTSVVAVDALLLVATFWHHAAIRLPQGLSRRLEWALITPRLHLLHHSQAKPDHDRNFGDLFSLWDRLFGSFAPPHGGMVRVGLAEEVAIAQSLPHQLAAPFRS
jgi:sterol desaturase/sphingolipid hydroxylase (fatty acid hydroxylase superfamily)